MERIALLLDVCCRSAGLLIENGSETYRAEETVAYLCEKEGAKVGVAVLSTTLFVQIDLDGKTRHAVRRLDKRTINLDCVAQVNDIVRRACDGTVTLEQADEQLRTLRSPGYGRLVEFACFCIAGLFAVFVYGGGMYDLIPAFLCGLVYPCMPIRWKDRVASQMIVYCASGALIAVLAMLARVIFPQVQPVAVVAAAAVSLYPGAAFVNAIRDTMHGDLVSGVARLSEALIKVGMLAAGAAAVFGIWDGTGLAANKVAGPQLVWIAHFAVSFVVVMCLAIEQNAPLRTVAVSSAIGAAAYVICLIFTKMIPFMPAAYFLGALFMSAASEWMARRMKLPATVFLVSAIMVLVPGKGLFDTMLYLASGVYGQLAVTGANTLVQMIAISMAIAIGTFCSRKMAKK